MLCGKLAFGACFTKQDLINYVKSVGFLKSTLFISKLLNTYVSRSSHISL